MKGGIGLRRNLFGIKLICLRSELNVASVRICIDAAFFGVTVSRF